MKLYVVPTNQVQRFWYLAEPLLQKALDKGNNEFTSGQLKLLVTQGQQQLLLVMKDEICYVALTVQWINYPNDRVAYITYIGGKNTKAGMEQFKQWLKKMVELQYRVLLNLKALLNCGIGFTDSIKNIN